MPRPCTVCQHHSLKAIDLAILAGEAVVPIGRRFGLSKSAVHRHKLQCLLAEATKPAIAGIASANTAGADPLDAELRSFRHDDGAAVERVQAVRPAGVAKAAPGPQKCDRTPTLADLVQSMVRSVERLERAAETAAGGGNGAALAAASGQLHKGVEILGRLIGIHEPGAAQVVPQINIVFPASPNNAMTIDSEAADDELRTPRRASDEVPAERFAMTLTPAAARPVSSSRRQSEEGAAEPYREEPARMVDRPRDDAPAFVTNLKIPGFDVLSGM